MSHHSELVTATVQKEDVHLLIGHPIWTRPADTGYSAIGYHKLIQVVETPTGNPHYPIEIHAIIKYQGKKHKAALPQSCTIQNVPKAQCNPTELGGTPWWEWKPPATQLTMF